LAAVELQALPFDEALAALQARGTTLHPSFSWQDVRAEEHSASFTVAKSVGFDILRDLHQSLRDTLAGGGTFADWARDIRPVLEAKGWWGRKMVVDPADGLIKEATLGTPRRLATIFDVNMRVSYAAGRWAQIQRVKEERPYLMYSAVLDRRTRPQHRAWNGIIRPVEDSFWDTHYPPNGWRCRCMVRQLGARDLARSGREVSPPPSFETRDFRNDRTGEVCRVPVGIDPGWAHNPGRLSRDASAAQAFATKWVDAPPEMAAAIESANRREVLPGLARGFADWVDGVETQLAAARAGRAAGDPPVIRTTGERRVVGALSQTVLDGLARHGKVPQTGALTVNDRALVHMLRDAKSSRGAALPVDQVRCLPEALAAPQAVLWDQQDPALIYVLDLGAGPGKIVVRVDFAERAKSPEGRYTLITNAVTTGGIVKPGDLRAPRYQILDGEIGR
jgi:SPP1 gp7 family putative phage head morphogenesis protein